MYLQIVMWIKEIQSNVKTWDFGLVWGPKVDFVDFVTVQTLFGAGAGLKVKWKTSLVTSFRVYSLLELIL